MNKLFIGSDNKTNFILESLADDFEFGVTIIDPTGQLAPAAANIVPSNLIQQVLYFDPSDMAHPVGLNVLEDASPDQHQLLVDQFCATFDALFPDGKGTLTRLNAEAVLANTLRILLDTPGSTLLDINKVLTDSTYRAKCINNCTDPFVKGNWTSIEAKPKQYDPAMAFLQTKMGRLLMSPMIRNIIGQPTTFTGASIIIANLDRAKIGSLYAQFLGNLLIARSSGRVYINDFASFASDNLTSLLAEDRFTISLNFLDELPQHMHGAMLRIDDKVVVKTHPKDAEVLAFYVGLMNPRRLVELREDEARTPTLWITAEPPTPAKQLKGIRKHTRAGHTRPRKLVEQTISRYFAALKTGGLQ